MLGVADATAAVIALVALLVLAIRLVAAEAMIVLGIALHGHARHRPRWRDS